MKKAGMRIILAFVIALTLVIGSASMANAAGKPSITAGINNMVHVGGQAALGSPCGMPYNQISISWQWSNLYWADSYTWELYNTAGGEPGWLVDSGVLDAEPNLTLSTDVYECGALNDDSYILVVKVYAPKAKRAILVITDVWP